MIGMMLCGEKKKSDGMEKDEFLYVGYNFHWETRSIALPNLPEGIAWKKVLDTGNLSGDGFCGEEGAICSRTVEMGPRTVAVLKGVKVPVKKTPIKKRKKEEGIENASVAAL